MTILVAEQPARSGETELASLRARLACRAGMASTTAGVANGFVQGNLAILPEQLAASATAIFSAMENAEWPQPPEPKGSTEMG